MSKSMCFAYNVVYTCTYNLYTCICIYLLTVGLKLLHSVGYSFEENVCNRDFMGAVGGRPAGWVKVSYQGNKSSDHIYL